MYKITTGDRMLTNLAVEYERLTDQRLPACSRKSGQLLETCCTIMDLKGVSITRVSSVYTYVRQASAISQNYYPERLGRLYLINAPWGFSSVWSIVKGWLDPVTVQKIQVLGGTYQAELLAQIPAENLPEHFGGLCACEGGCENSDAGPWKEKEWTRPAKWEEGAKEKKPDAVIENAGGVSYGGDEGKTAAPAPAAPAKEDEEEEEAPAAPVPAPAAA
jgi:hypothetical protein